MYSPCFIARPVLFNKYHAFKHIFHQFSLRWVFVRARHPFQASRFVSDPLSGGGFGATLIDFMDLIKCLNQRLLRRPTSQRRMDGRSEFFPKLTRAEIYGRSEMEEGVERCVVEGVKRGKGEHTKM